MDAIRTTNLTKCYGNARGITGLNLTVAKGEFFGFIGPNGAGKSTTIRTLLGLIHPTGGSASVLGMDIAGDRQKLLARVGYLPSEAGLYPNMRVHELLKLSARLRKADCADEARLLCERFQLDPTRRLNELSFGNRKKAAIICALQHKPELLMLDEPTGGLDPLMQREFFSILCERNQAGATVFLSSHVLSEVQTYCHRAAFIRDGRLFACDSVEALLGGSAKHVRIRGELDLHALPGVQNLREENGVFAFLYAGDMDRLTQHLASGHIDDLSISDPTLEEIFLHDYEEGGDAQ